MAWVSLLGVKAGALTGSTGDRESQQSEGAVRTGEQGKNPYLLACYSVENGCPRKATMKKTDSMDGEARKLAQLSSLRVQPS